ncbi:MerR family transcriptional regulator [Rugosimonospora africana]|uniref:MerR family transcriptional regulator n=1 Tax=Rugosimonospora africana TaxID=556532 RepID=A0A8J3QRL3_9ACTN|nr:MerR family transcriptional regulator [Rugosimonospora africana]GIH15603.1 MerR family transcriptional regulator [Rugosimonospora africana]
MSTLLSIGDFSRMTYLSIKALRHYHDAGLLEPAETDPATGYRRYSAQQVPVAQVVRRFRELGMPLRDIKEVLEAPDVGSRNEMILGHLRRMERQLSDVQTAVTSLRRLIEAGDGPVPVRYRTVPPAWVLAVDDRIAMGDLDAWWSESFGRLTVALAATGARRAGADGALYHEDYFTSDTGTVVAFVPIAHPVPVDDPVYPTQLPAAEFAIATHRGGFDTIDRTYGALGTHVAERELGVDGPIRETYLVTAADTPDETQHRTEVCWPIFQTASPR